MGIQLILGAYFTNYIRYFNDDFSSNNHISIFDYIYYISFLCIYGSFFSSLSVYLFFSNISIFLHIHIKPLLLFVIIIWIFQSLYTFLDFFIYKISSLKIHFECLKIVFSSSNLNPTALNNCNSLSIKLSILTMPDLLKYFNSSIVKHIFSFILSLFSKISSKVKLTLSAKPIAYFTVSSIFLMSNLYSV